MKRLYLLCFVLIACQNNNETNSTAIDTTKEPVIKNFDTDNKSSPPVQDTDLRIIAGERMGKVKLGEDVSSLEVLGRPDKSDAAMGKAWLYWYGKRDEHNNATELDVYTAYKDSTMRDKTVQQVRTTSSQFATENQIHVYSSLKEIEQKFPEIRKIAYYNEDGRNLLIYDAVEKGIAFEIAKANDQPICTGIIIHKKGKPVTDIYIMLHPDMQRLSISQ